MIDVEPLIIDQLERLAPQDDVPDSRWEQLRPRRRRAPLAAAAAIVVLVACGATFAAVTDNVPWWQSGSPPANPTDLAQQLVDVQGLPQQHLDLTHARTVATDGDAALVAVPFGATGYCLVPFFGDKPYGAQCEWQVRDATSGGGDWVNSIDVGDRAWLAYGRLADPRAATFVLGGSFTVRLSPGGFFMLNVPRNDWQQLALTADRGHVLDASGNVLHDGCVTWGLAPGASSQLVDPTLWHDGSGPCRPAEPLERPQVDQAQAQTALEVTLTQRFSIWQAGDRVALREAVDQQGDRCYWPDYAVASNPLPILGGLTCAPATWIDPLHVTLNSGGTIIGIFQQGSDVARVEIQSPSRTVEATVGGGAFFAQLPVGDEHTMLPPGGPWIVVAYDASGKEVARENLDTFLKEAEPH